MCPSFSDAKLSVGQVLARLRQVHQPDHKDLAEALHISYTTYLKIERDQRDLSFLMALRICRFYQLDLHEFISMLSEAELERHDRSIIRDQEKRERKKAEALKARVIDMKTKQAVPRSLL
ncbi:MAG: helix-turn-helix domain-containing protein [Mucilaginibacter sp.]